MEYVKSMLGYGKMSPELKKAMKRLEKDRQELEQSPVTNISAAPLDSNLLEWHCNILHNGHMFHLILFFPKEYPCISPSAEFVPQGFNFQGGATMPGKKGTKICLSIFSDFAHFHPEWKDETSTGWSPGYTVQTVLLNVVSFLADMQDVTDRHPYIGMCKQYVCKDCGHTAKEPYPPVNVEMEDGEREIQDETAKVDNEDKPSQELQAMTYRIIDYVSKERFTLLRPASNDQLFGYGLAMSENPRNPQLTSPCEFLAAASFNDMVSSLGGAQSVHREKLRFFLPLYITDEHGFMIKDQFEKTMQKIASVVLPENALRSMTNIVVKVIPNLMCSTVVQFSKGTVHTSDNSLEGYFALHRLFLWAVDTYPGLMAEINRRLQSFVSHRRFRNKKECPDIGQWLMFLSVSGAYNWEDVAQAYLSESYNRNVMWYLKTDKSLGNDQTPMEYRLQRTFELTKVGRNLLAFQVAFLKIAKPSGMSRGDVLRRYAANLGFPTHEMVQELKNVYAKITNEVTRYDLWFKVIGVPVPSKAELHKTLLESVTYAKCTEGYYFTNNNNRGRR